MNDMQKLILAGGFLLLAGGVVLLSYDRFAHGAGVLKVELQRNEIEKAQQELAAANEYLRQNSSESARKALDLFNEVLSRNLNERINHLARYGLAIALERIDDRATALEHLKQLKSESSKMQDQDLKDKVDYALGRMYLFINHEDEGRSLLDGLLARTQDNRLKSNIHAAWGSYYLTKGDRARAKNSFNVALGYFPENLQAEMGRANATNGTGRVAYYQYYDDYLVGNANLAPIQRRVLANELREGAYEAGIRAYRTNRYQDAVDLFTRVLRDGRDTLESEKARYWMAESLQAMGNKKAAYENYEQVLGNVPTAMDQPALIRMGILLYQQGKLQEALNRFYRASENYPEGSYTQKALEWKKETEAQIRDQEYLKNYDERKKEDKEKVPAESSGGAGLPPVTGQITTSVAISPSSSEKEKRSEEVTVEFSGEKPVAETPRRMVEITSDDQEAEGNFSDTVIEVDGKKFQLGSSGHPAARK